MAYPCQATEKFWTGFYGLSDSQKESVRRAWTIFKQDPFDARLQSPTHLFSEGKSRGRQTGLKKAGEIRIIADAFSLFPFFRIYLEKLFKLVTRPQ